MTAPLLWIILPFVAGALILLLSQKMAAWVGGLISALLSLTALFIPIDVALLLGSVSLKISPSIQVFGRSFDLNTADGPLLALIYGLAAIWFFGTEAAKMTNRFVALGLMILALLTASIAVEPFLYAALLIEVAAMLVIPLLAPPYQNPGRGVVRFLIYQTLAMPFILFSGWMLAGVEASPGDLSSTLQAGIMLGMGFAFLFAIFPLYNWIPMLTEESSPYAVGFLLWALPTFTVIFCLGFFDRYAWLRSTPQFSNAIQFAGVFMVASGGIFAALQRHLGRIFGYAAIVETGLIVLVLGLNGNRMVDIAFLTLIPRGLELAVWALALTIIKSEASTLRFSEVQGLARKYPAAVAAIILAHLSMMGFPLLAGFPSRLALWGQLAAQSITFSFWVILGVSGLLVAVIRSLAVFVMSSENVKWEFNESWIQVGMLSIGVLGLFILGMFPQTMQLFLTSLPSLFEHLVQ